MHSITMTVERDEKEIEVTIEATYNPGCRGARDGRWGPPIEPDEPAHFEIESAKDENGNEIELTDSELETAQDQFMGLMQESRHYDDSDD
jgi:hypothetical protein